MELINKLLEDKLIGELIKSVKENTSGLFSGVDNEMLPLLLSLIKDDYFIVMPTEKMARDIVKDLNFYNIEADYLPPRDKVYYDIKVIDDENMFNRLEIFHKLITGENKILAMSLYTFLESKLKLDIYKNNSIEFIKGERLDIDGLFKRLIASGYNRVSRIESRGEFSFRGSILDIFPSHGNELLRVEFFDDEIDTIRLVDPESRLSTEFINSFKIFPSIELIIEDEDIPNIISKIEEEMNLANIDEDKENRFRKLVEDLKDKSITGEREILFSYMNENDKSRIYEDISRPIVVYNYEDGLRELNSKNEFEKGEYQTLFEKQEVLNARDFDNRLYEIDKDEIDTAIIEIQYLSNLEHKDREIKLISQNRFQRDYLTLFEEVENNARRGIESILVANEKERLNQLIKVAAELELVYSTDEASDALIKIIYGKLYAGFFSEDLNLSVYGEVNIFGAGEKKIRTKKRKSSKLRITDITEGDYVIHEDHGIGIYNGVKSLEIKGIRRDYLEILYKDADKLYLPVENINLIDKYTSKDGVKPKIFGLYSAQWKKTKERSKKAIDEMAKDLIDLYAIRTSEIGFQFSKDTPWQREFEQSFKYDETDGQLISTDQIKADMESPHPMDRLLLGDVGYGKTEVAFRAAFKAIMDGKQVAMLAPTTLLSEQHTKTAIDRFKSFPIKIKNLSRFRSPKEIKETVNDIKSGNVDFVIGTHRLLSKDIKFADLGLLIVDEEQRFGVRHKEKIKELSKGVDVLTLSATPIPRTMSMSLSGIRSLSVIEDPPRNRLPVQTYVAEYNEGIVRSAILREIERGGQVYFLYNDVKTQDLMASKLSELVPEARFQIANGQMKERELEDIFDDFEKGNIDVLITSTIIETGMDVSNVNTLIVYDAQRLGLSTLYQLRGRVGRSERLAYAYFTYRKGQSISEKAIKRLMTMKEFTDFGSGYKIAMRDLEIRGAGNVLGLKQSGHMMEIGYELYMKYLNLAIKELKGESVEDEINAKIDLEIDSALPDYYLNDPIIRMEIYRRIAKLDNIDDMENWIDELVDRYNEVPKSLENLMYIGIFKNWAQKCSIISIIQNNNWVRIEYDPKMLDKIDMDAFLKEFSDLVQFDRNTPIIRIKVESIVKDLLKFFRIGFSLGRKNEKK
ncbi:MAG: transcription-repair coupling factor [Firmicutes bacterium]|nr:transcription-repair coupling factor [Bacillota bacterium]